MILLFLFIIVLFSVWIQYRRVTYLGNFVIEKGLSVDVSHPIDGTTAHTLYQLRTRANRLVQALDTEFPNDVYVLRLKQRFTGSIHELEHGRVGVFGYNRNKGDISVCLHDKQNKSNRFNDIFFVLMHEMSHMMTNTFEHDQTFEQQFTRMIRIAVKYGLYEYVDYGKTPSAFCNGYIQQTPYRKKIRE